MGRRAWGLWDLLVLSVVVLGHGLGGNRAHGARCLWGSRVLKKGTGALGYLFYAFWAGGRETETSALPHPTTDVVTPTAPQ